MKICCFTKRDKVNGYCYKCTEVQRTLLFGTNILTLRRILLFGTSVRP